jgi:hypothetical protein
LHEYLLSSKLLKVAKIRENVWGLKTATPKTISFSLIFTNIVKLHDFNRVLSLLNLTREPMTAFFLRSSLCPFSMSQVHIAPVKAQVQAVLNHPAQALVGNAAPVNPPRGQAQAVNQTLVQPQVVNPPPA